jgi:hypothetical protein
MVIERMIRGLYYHHYNEILGEKVICRVQWLKQLNQGLLKVIEEFPQKTVGSSQLVYRYGRAAEDPLYSTWLFQFYGRHWASGYTQPTTESDDSF